MRKHTNVQTHVIVIVNPEGRVWVVGTDTQRNFTNAGADKAEELIREKLPPKWSVWSEALSPISDVLALTRPRMV